MKNLFKYLFGLITMITLQTNLYGVIIQTIEGPHRSIDIRHFNNLHQIYEAAARAFGVPIDGFRLYIQRYLPPDHTKKEYHFLHDSTEEYHISAGQAVINMALKPGIYVEEPVHDSGINPDEARIAELEARVIELETRMIEIGVRNLELEELLAIASVKIMKVKKD